MTGGKKQVLILGGTSDIGVAAASIYAQQGWSVCLAARDIQAAHRNAADIATRTGAEVTVAKLDVLERNDFDQFFSNLARVPDTVICCVGLLADQKRNQQDSQLAATVMQTNYTGPCLLIGRFAELFSERGSGLIIGVSSVAGDRGRASNYVYGSAKAGFTAFLSGLRNRFRGTPIRVVTIKPGFVDTRMTAGMDLPPILLASPNEVGAAIFSAEKSTTDVAYVRRIWAVIMLFVVLLPERVFKRLPL